MKVFWYKKRHLNKLEFQICRVQIQILIKSIFYSESKIDVLVNLTCSLQLPIICVAHILNTILDTLRV